MRLEWDGQGRGSTDRVKKGLGSGQGGGSVQVIMAWDRSTRLGGRVGSVGGSYY